MKKIQLIVLLLLIVIVSACQDEPRMESQDLNEDEAIEVDQSSDKKENKRVEVELIDREGVTVGSAQLEQQSTGVLITLEADHLPEGVHGFHIHEKGICETPDFESAGAHFNPTHKKHGFNNPEGPHAGDLPNIKVKKDGTVKVKVLNDKVTLETGVKNSLMNEEGTALIIHADPDDYVSQPAGNSGDRIVCGVISKKK